jgi:hypothetical protein
VQVGAELLRCIDYVSHPNITRTAELQPELHRIAMATDFPISGSILMGGYGCFRRQRVHNT